MKSFQGFSSKAGFTCIPNSFFNRLMADIDNISELRLSLYIMARIYPQKSFPRFVRLSELEGDAFFLIGSSRPSTALRKLSKALLNAVERGTVLKLEVEVSGKTDTLYFLNDDEGQQAIEAISSGKVNLKDIEPAAVALQQTAPPPNIITLYEENIGMLSPMLADELKEAEKNYPAGWIAEAIKEAATNNKRNLKYITKILERWAAQGKEDGAYKRDSEKEDPNKYVKGKYGHLVRRR